MSTESTNPVPSTGSEPPACEDCEEANEFECNLCGARFCVDHANQHQGCPMIPAVNAAEQRGRERGRIEGLRSAATICADVVEQFRGSTAEWTAARCRDHIRALLATPITPETAGPEVPDDEPPKPWMCRCPRAALIQRTGGVGPWLCCVCKTPVGEAGRVLLADYDALPSTPVARSAEVERTWQLERIDTLAFMQRYRWADLGWAHFRQCITAGDHVGASNRGKVP